MCSGHNNGYSSMKRAWIEDGTRSARSGGIISVTPSDMSRAALGMSLGLALARFSGLNQTRRTTNCGKT